MKTVVLLVALCFAELSCISAKLETVKSVEKLPESLKSLVKLEANQITFAPSSTIHRIAFPAHQLPFENVIRFQLSIAEIKPEFRDRCLSDTVSRPFELIFGNETDPECIFQLIWSVSTDATTQSSVSMSSVFNGDGTIDGVITSQPGTETLNFQLTKTAPLSIIWPNVNAHKIPMGPGPVISGFSDDSNWLPITKCFPETYVEDDLRLLNIRFEDLNYPNCDWRLILENVQLVLPNDTTENIDHRCPSDYTGPLIAFFGTSVMIGALIVYLTVTHYRETHPKVPPVKPLY